VYSHPSLFADSYFAVLKIRAVAPRIKIHHSDLSVDTSSIIVSQLEQAVDSYHTASKECKGQGTRSSAHHNVSAMKEHFKYFFFDVEYIYGFVMLGGL